MYQIKIYDNDKEYVGIVFFGTNKSNTGEDHNDFQHIYDLQVIYKQNYYFILFFLIKIVLNVKWLKGLKEPSAERIKELDKFTSGKWFNYLIN